MELTCLSHTEVYLDGKLLDIKPSLKIVNHSPTGFSWGYGGSGPAQLALAVMLETLPEESMHLWEKHYQDFKSDVIARLPQKPCALEFDFWGWYQGKDAKECINLLKELSFDPKDLDKNGEVDARSGRCTDGFGDRCMQANSSDCDCQCGGVNHGKQINLFT